MPKNNYTVSPTSNAASRDPRTAARPRSFTSARRCPVASPRVYEPREGETPGLKIAINSTPTHFFGTRYPIECQKVSYTLYIVSKSVIYALYSVKKCLIHSISCYFQSWCFSLGIPDLRYVARYAREDRAMDFSIVPGKTLRAEAGPEVAALLEWCFPGRFQTTDVTENARAHSYYARKLV